MTDDATRRKHGAKLLKEFERLKKRGVPAVEAVRAAMQNKGEGSVTIPEFIRQLKQHIDQHSESPGAAEEQRLRDILYCVLVQRNVNEIEVENAVSLALQQSKGDVSKFTDELQRHVERPGYWGDMTN